MHLQKIRLQFKNNVLQQSQIVKKINEDYEDYYVSEDDKILFEGLVLFNLITKGKRDEFCQSLCKLVSLADSPTDKLLLAREPELQIELQKLIGCLKLEIQESEQGQVYPGEEVADALAKSMFGKITMSL